MSGNDVIAGVTTPFSISVRYNFTVDKATLSLVGSAQGSASLGLLSSGRINSNGISLGLAPGMDGSWSAQMDAISLGRIGGSGGIVLSNGRVLPVNLNGNYNTATTVSRVVLSGIASGGNDGRGTSVRLSFLPNTVQPETLNGTILGQRVVQ